MPELPDWTETERVRQQEKERFVRIAGLHIKTNTGGRNEHPQKITAVSKPNLGPTKNPKNPYSRFRLEKK